jgi:hypothetical protein
LITERAERLVASLDRRDALRVDVRRVDSFQTRETQLRRAVERIEPLARACALLRAHGEPVEGAADHVTAAARQVAALRRLYQSDRNAFIDPKQAEFRRFEAVFEQGCAQLEQATLRAWRRYLARHRKDLSAETLNVLSSISTYSAHVRSIRQQGERLSALATRLPTGEGDFTEVEGIEARMGEAWDALDSTSLSPAVLAFLRATSAPDGAPLALLNREVLEWIQEHHLGDDFHVRVGSSGGRW